MAKMNFELSIEKNGNLPSEQGPGFSGFCGALPSEQSGEEPSLERTIVKQYKGIAQNHESILFM